MSLGTRIAELEKIRNFLTGEALTTVIDAAFSVIYILVMALYSWVLTLIALNCGSDPGRAITLVGAHCSGGSSAKPPKKMPAPNLTSWKC